MAFFDQPTQRRMPPFVRYASGTSPLPLAAVPSIRPGEPKPNPLTPYLTTLAGVSSGYGDPSGLFHALSSGFAGGGGGGGGGGGFGPGGPPGMSSEDLQAAIANDPLYQQMQAQLAAEHAADVAQRAAARQRAVALYGEVPEFEGGAAGDSFSQDINEATIKLAQENTAAGLSTVARISKAHVDAIEGIRNALAARGILSSGETGYQLDREDLAHTQTSFDATQQLLDYLMGVQSGYVNSERARAMALANAAAGAASRLTPYGYGWPQPGGGGAPPSPGSPASSSAVDDYYRRINEIKKQLGYGTSQPWTAGL